MAYDESEKWAARLARSVAVNVRRLREEHTPPLSAQALSERTHALGHRVHRTFIADLEAGRRASIALPELLVLARALDAPPLALISPLDGNGRVEVLPGAEAYPGHVVDWFAGFRPDPVDPGAAQDNYARNADLFIRKALLDHSLGDQGVAEEALLLPENVLPPAVRAVLEEAVTKRADEFASRLKDLQRRVQSRGGDPASVMAGGIAGVATSAFTTSPGVAGSESSNE